MNLVELLPKIDELKAEIDALRPIASDQERRIMQKFRLDWTYHSNAIEGNTLTYGETRAFLLHDVTAQGKPFRDYLDMKGHHAAIDELLEIIQQKIPLTEATIRELHKMILVEPYEMPAVTMAGQPTKRRIVPGQYKSTPNHVETSTGEVHYYASPEETPARMADLVNWYRKQVEDEALHPLTLAATFHYQFANIHPFDDGNGRMARLLMNLILMQADYPPTIIPLDTKNEYLLALEQADADENLEPFVLFVGQALLKSLELFLRGAQGEDIEEMGDLGKKLNLLESQLRHEGVIPQNEKTVENLTILYDQWLRSFLKELHNQLQQFDRFFSKRKVDILIQTTSGSKSGAFTWGLDHIKKSLQIDHELFLIDYQYDWMDFVKDSTFNMKVEILVNFRKYDFNISYYRNDITETTLLSSKYNSDYIENWQEHIQTVTNHLFLALEKKTQDIQE